MNILVLEDDKYRTMWLKNFYKHNDCYFADNVKDAKKLSQEREYDILMLDHDLGGQTFVDSDNENSGYQFAKYLIESRAQEKALCIVHSCNPWGADNIGQLLRDNDYRVIMLPFTNLMYRGLHGGKR